MASNAMPPWFSGGEVAEKLNEWLHYLLVRLPISGLNTQILETADGRAINARQGGGAGMAMLRPWRISTSGNPTDGYFAHVRPGTVNQLVPTNIFDDYAIAADTTYYVKAKCDTDGMTPNLITVVLETTPLDSSIAVTENTAPPTFYITLGIIVAGIPAGDGSFTAQIFQIANVNYSAQPGIDFYATRTPPSIGDEPFVRWYHWEIYSAG